MTIEIKAAPKVAGDVDVATTMAATDHLLASVGGATRRVSPDVLASVSTFPTIAAMAASERLIDGASYTVDAGYNGERETFEYDAGSAVTADGALVVDATGMGAGRLISKRSEYASDAAMVADNRDYGHIDEGAILTAAGFDYEVAASGASDNDRETDGGLKLNIVPAQAKRVIYDAQFGNDTGALQKTVNYALNNGIGKLLLTKDHTLTETLLIDPQLYNDGFKIEGYGRTCVIEQTGAGKDCVKLSETVIWQDGGMTDLHLKCAANAGHVVTFGKGLDTFDGRGLQITQENPGKSLVYGVFTTSETGVYRCDFGEAKWSHASTLDSTVPGFYIRSGPTARFNENKFRGMRFYNSAGAQFFDIAQNANPTSWLTNNTFENLDFEICKGGAFKVANAKGWAFRGISFWDLNAAYTGHLMHFASVAGSYESISNVIERFQRHGDSLSSGVKDIYLEAAQDTALINNYTPNSDGPAYDLNNKRVFKAGLMYGLENTASLVDMSALQQVLPKAVVTAEKLSFGTETELTIASGEVTVTGSRHRIDTEADAATDDLVTISGGTDGMIVTLRAENDARDVVVKNGANIRLNGAADFTLDRVYDRLTLMYDSALSAWVEIGRCEYP